MFLSAFFFYLATVTIKWSQNAGLKIDPAFFVFSRFTLGFLCVLVLLLIRKKRIQVKKKSYLLGRTIANCVAVYCFFKGVELTSVAQANILNMTYPLFITLFSWVFLKQQRDVAAVFIVVADLNTSRKRPPSGCSMRFIVFKAFCFNRYSSVNSITFL